jgi:Ni,Fe-hydrogenase I cytochrome b subunit
MWPTFKESISNAFHPSRWSKLNPPQRYDVAVLWLSFIGIIFTGLVLYYSYVQAQEENFEKTTGPSKFNITEVHVITKHVTIFTIRDSENNTEYILYDHSNGMFDNQAVLLDINRGKGENK